MIHQRFKDLFFYGVGLYSLATFPVHKIRFNSRPNKCIQLGSGNNKLPGFINIDINPLANPDLVYNISIRLPFGNGSADIIYSSHTLEHFYPDELFSIFKDTYRVLKKGGIMRLVVPDLGKSITAYTNRDHDYFIDFPRSFKSMGGRFANYIFCDAQHKISFDFEFIKELLENAGFRNIYRSEIGMSEINSNIYKKLQPIEEAYKNNSLFVEVKK